MIIYCVRISIGGKRKCLCSDKVCVFDGGFKFWVRDMKWEDR